MLGSSDSKSMAMTVPPPHPLAPLSLPRLGGTGASTLAAPVLAMREEPVGGTGAGARALARVVAVVGPVVDVLF